MAVAELVECRDTKRVMRATNFTTVEHAFGDYSAGRFGWILRNARRLDTPIPFRGAQGLFDIPDSLVQEAAA